MLDNLINNKVLMNTVSAEEEKCIIIWESVNTFLSMSIIKIQIFYSIDFQMTTRIL